VAEDSVFDASGALRCRSCETNARATTFEQRAALSRIRRRRGLIAIVCVLTLALTYVVFTTVRDRWIERERKHAHGRIRERLKPARNLLAQFDRQGHATCDDDALRPRASTAGEPWAMGRSYSSRLLRASELAEVRSAAARLEAAHFFVGLVATDTRRAWIHGWRGHVVVVDLDAGRAVCWAPLEIDDLRGRIYVDDDGVRAEARSSLATISTILTLAE
jgi:hypothetical protein